MTTINSLRRINYSHISLLPNPNETIRWDGGIICLTCTNMVLDLQLQVNIAYRSGMIFSIIDERMGSYPSECVEKFVNLALKCCQENTDSRPSMAEVYRELENIWLMMPESDTNFSESLASDSGKIPTTPTSLSSTRNPYVSQDVSGSDLVSGVVPTIAPR